MNKFNLLPGTYLSRNMFPWLLSLILFFTSYGLSLFYLDAIYWDDWVLFNMSPEYILKMFEEVGAIYNWAGYLHLLLLSIGPEIYRILTFVLMFFSGYILWHILQDLPFLNSTERNSVSLLFILLPFYPARIALINFPYTLCYFCFFAAWYLLIVKFNVKNTVLAVAIFFFSFNTNSILVFYIIPLCHAIYHDFREKDKLISHNKYFLFGKYLLLFSLPIIYFYIKTLYFAPSGLNEGYNSLSLEGLKSGLILACPLAIVFITWLIFKVILRTSFLNRGIILVFWGSVIRWLAIFPYAAVGKLPSFDDWNSRFQLLMPLGVALIILGAFSWLSYGRVVRAVVLVLLLSSARNFYVSYEYYADWLKQETVIELIAKSDSIQNARTILFNDRAMKFNARGRSYRFYEYNGWLKMAYGDETRFGINATTFQANSTDNTLNNYRWAFTGLYNAADYKNGSPDIVVTISCNTGRIKALLTGGQCFTLNVEEYKE